MIWDLYQQKGINEARSTATSASHKVDRQKEQLNDLLRHIDRLSLASQAMWELLRDYSDLTEEHLEAKMLEIDGRDGKVDGKMSATTFDCPHCGRPTNSRRDNCVMCGAPLPRQHKFGG